MTSDELVAKVKTLNELMWERRLHWSDVEAWLAQFRDEPHDGYEERLHALYLLSHFSFFNLPTLRVLLRALYRDFIQYPLAAHIRKRLRATLDWSQIEPHYERALASVRFVGVGNPAESGTHLLYYFRQENRLPTHLFVHPHELIEGTTARPRLAKGVKHVIFLDDFCGSGTQAKRYSKRLLPRIRELSARVRVSYFPLFATSVGLRKVRDAAMFDDVSSVCELDESFRAVAPESRYFREPHDGISREFAERLCREYGAKLEPGNPLGFGKCQLLLGFAHNIPNNSLPIFWSRGSVAQEWVPVFRRYTKGMGW